MANNRNLILKLPPFMRESKIYQAIFSAEERQYADRDDAIADLMLQLSVDTATWAIVIYENELGIPIEPSKPIEERRSVVKSKMRGAGKVDSALIKLVADSFSNGDVDVEFDGSIRIKFTSVVGIPPNMEDLQEAIEEIKPAHLPVIYIVLYNTYSTLAQYTHGQLAAYTHEQLRSTQLP